MRPCRAQPFSSRLGGRSSGQSWLSCVPTMQASVESHVSKGAKRGAAGAADSLLRDFVYNSAALTSARPRCAINISGTIKRNAGHREFTAGTTISLRTETVVGFFQAELGLL